ncbi:MAG TPA: ABC transporter ATP-binding protein, partial [Afipia sp.]|nr:ABC transporter ATP-binding protein [Afipia sp.]
MIASGPCAIDVLNVDRLHAWYGESHILHGMSFSLRRGGGG